ncbi:MAG: hypothetical protein IIT65_03630, partial [Lachnospiraceae bacterium]|nr:hypothetical protein [Lachnospiraceae bacterium]
MAKIKAKKKDNRLSVKVKLQMGEKLDDRGLEQFSVISIRGLLKLEKNKKRIVCYSGPMGISLYEKLMSP